MWDVASTTAALTTFYADAGTILTLVIGTILGALIALMGLGYGVRKTKKQITGGKF